MNKEDEAPLVQEKGAFGCFSVWNSLANESFGIFFYPEVRLKQEMLSWC